MIQNFNSVSLLCLYTFIQRNFLHYYKIIRNQPTEDANNSSRDATRQDIQQRNERESTGPEEAGGIGRSGGPGAYINTRIGKGTGTSLVANAPQRLGRAGGPGCFVSAKGADKSWSSNSANTSEGISTPRGPRSLVSTRGADEDMSFFLVPLV